MAPRASGAQSPKMAPRCEPSVAEEKRVTHLRAPRAYGQGGQSATCSIIVRLAIILLPVKLLRDYVGVRRRREVHGEPSVSEEKRVTHLLPCKRVCKAQKWLQGSGKAEKWLQAPRAGPEVQKWLQGANHPSRKRNVALT